MHVSITQSGSTICSAPSSPISFSASRHSVFTFFAIGTLAAPVNKIIEAGIPVVDMDTLIAPLDTINVLTFLAPDNEFMGASVTQALVSAINGEGTIVMTQGALGYTGAQGRARGFKSVV